MQLLGKDLEEAIRVEHVIVIEIAGVLSDRIECTSCSAESSPVGTVRMGCANDVWPCAMYLGMDCKGSVVQESVPSAIDYFAFMTHENEVVFSNEGEV